ncbi:MAG: amidohydrolase [Chloroflexi bacterium]|nr:amidohydrolase [Chloroflexota bacterium]
MPRAIDIHVHPPIEPGRPPPRYQDYMDRFFKSGPRPNAEEMAALYQELDLLGVLLATNAESTMGDPPVRNEWVAELVARYPDRFIGFCAVDVWQGKKAVRELERAVKELGLKGLKLHPMMQEFFPNDRQVYPIYEKCVELGVPVLFHSGTTVVGAGMPGGGGIRLKYGRPIYVDDVAVDFPDLTIILAHPSVPWHDEQLAIALHKPNVYIDLSGWAPKYFPPNVIQYANTLLQDKVLFGSDYPGVRPDRWLREFEAGPFKEEVRPKILLENARSVLKLHV